MAIVVNIGLGKGLFPEGTKPLPKPTLTYIIPVKPYDLRSFSQEIPQPSDSVISL